ncbi:DUF58 domain-containing protein [Treponema sp. OMZ 840]|uniref:DUF58 domain-containing protein n=1 Tax=Treponema sp. OMZ 840 TaxID=244313 RepID=UPI003D9481E1
MKQKSVLLPDAGILAEKASLLRLRARTLSDSLRAGSSRSFYKGRGIDFSGVREYLWGDDIRSIDWNVTARMGKPFVKLFEEERELIVFLVVDMSSSMNSGSKRRSRLTTAAETAALLILSSVHNASPIGAVFFDGEIFFSSAPKNKKDHAMLLFSKLNLPPPKNKSGTALPQALRGAAKLLKNRSLVIIISDFRCGGYEEELALLAQKHEVVGICITDPSEEALPPCGSLLFSDTESGIRMILPTSSEHFKREWKDFHKRHAERRQMMLLRRGVSYMHISTEEDPLYALVRFFSSREN